jgi:hypothetical protein
MIDRRHLLLGCFAGAWTATANAATLEETADLDRLGKFELVRGRPGVVIGVPHATPDTGTSETGRILCERLGAAGVFVTGFWDSKTRQRVNVNRPTEQIIGPDSEVVRQWPSDRAAAANSRYVAFVRDAAQGPLRIFCEIHSNRRPDLAKSIAISTLGLRRKDAARLKDAFAAARDRLPADVPRLAIHVSPLDRVTYPDYGAASSIAKLSEKGCAIENPGQVFATRAWRIAYAHCLADAIEAAQWARE